jgi:hypothetical protein
MVKQWMPHLKFWISVISRAAQRIVVNYISVGYAVLDDQPPIHIIAA